MSDKQLPLLPLCSLKPPTRNPNREKTKRENLQESLETELQCLQRKVETLTSHNKYLAAQNHHLQKQVDTSKEYLSTLVEIMQSTLRKCITKTEDVSRSLCKSLGGDTDEGTITICSEHVEGRKR